MFTLALGGGALLAPVATGTWAARTVTPNPPCGSTVTANVKLHSNMNCPGSSGLVVGNSHITINLNGHSIVGDGTSGTYGVDNGGGFKKVTVENGTIRDFQDGIWYDNTSGGKIEKLATTANTKEGVFFENSSNASIGKLRSTGNGDTGALLYSNTKVALSDSKLNNNALDGVVDEFSLDALNGDTMNHNGSATTSECGTDVTCWGTFGYGEGVLLYAPSATYVVENSTANHNTNNGFVIEENLSASHSQAKLTGNEADDNGLGDTVEPTSKNEAIGWGYWAQRRVPGGTNTSRGNDTGACRNVSCKNSK